MHTKIGIVTKTPVAIATHSGQELVWLQYSLQHLLGRQVELLDLKALPPDTAGYAWIILDCCGVRIDRAYVEEQLSQLQWRKGRVIVRLSSMRELEGEIDGVHVLKGHAKSPEFAAIIEEAL